MRMRLGVGVCVCIPTYDVCAYVFTNSRAIMRFIVSARVFLFVRKKASNVRARIITGFTTVLRTYIELTIIRFPQNLSRSTMCVMLFEATLACPKFALQYR